MENTYSHWQFSVTQTAAVILARVCRLQKKLQTNRLTDWDFGTQLNLANAKASKWSVQYCSAFWLQTDLYWKCWGQDVCIITGVSYPGVKSGQVDNASLYSVGLLHWRGSMASTQSYSKPWGENMCQSFTTCNAERKLYFVTQFSSECFHLYIWNLLSCQTWGYSIWPLPGDTMHQCSVGMC